MIKKLIKTLCGGWATSDVILEEQRLSDVGSKINYNISRDNIPVFCKTKVVIHGYEIEEPLVYVGDNKRLDIAIDPTKPVSKDGDYYVRYNFISATYSDYSEYERHLYLVWLAGGKKSTTSERVLTLYFRNLQQRAVLEGQDQDLILFEVINIYDRYTSTIKHHFSDNYLPLFLYLVFTKNGKFNEKEQEILISFVKKYGNDVHIRDLYSELIFKIREGDFEDLSQFPLKNASVSEKIDHIFEYIATKDIHNSCSKFYKAFDKKIPCKTFRNRDLLYTTFRILMYNNRNLLNEKNIKFEVRERIIPYRNYYFYNINNYFYDIGNEIILTIGMSIKKIFHEALCMIGDYILSIEKLCQSRGHIGDRERYEVLPQLLKDYFSGLLPANIDLPDVQSNVLDRKIETDGITERMRLCFGEKNLKTVGDLVQKTEKELLEFKGFGKSSLRDTKEYLEIFGLSLKQNDITKQKDEILLPVGIEFSINKEKLFRIREDTIEVQNVLMEIFVEGEENEIVVVGNGEDLDRKYLDFIDFIRTKKSWAKKELNNYCKNNKLLLNDVISTVNGYYDEKYGEYLIGEEEGGFTVNDV
ncbi:MAG: TerB N-terminal domain-containing protein [Rickettsiales bacterium]|jgi:hypothetical protein|nr:TerB N-terminal domain-containing protein [Rickettsiales bacterium]